MTRRLADSHARTAPPGLHGLFRYAKPGRTRSYGLRAVSDQASELWVVAETRGQPLRCRKLVTFDDEEDATRFLQDVELELRRGGWSRV